MKISRLYKPIILTIYELFFLDRSDTHVTHVVNPTTTTSQESILWRPFDISPRHIPNTLDEVDHDWIWGIILQWSNMVKLWSFVWNYIVQLNGSVALHKPLYIKHLNIQCCFDPLLELAPRERWSKNQALMKRLRNVGRCGG